MSKNGTRRGNNEGMIRYNEAKDIWEGRVIVGRDGSTGKPKYRFTTGASQTEVRKKNREILSDVEAGTYIEPSILKMKDWLPFWLKTYKLDVSRPIAPKTRDSYQLVIDKYIVPRFGEYTPSKMEDAADDIQAWVNTIAKEKHRTAEIALSVLKLAIKQAVKSRKMRWNPCDAVTLGQAEEEDTEDDEILKRLNDAEFAAVWSAIMTSRHKAALLILITGGLRIGEMCPLKESDIDFDAGTLRVTKNVVRVNNTAPGAMTKTMYIEQPRTKTSAGRRTVPLPLVTLNAIQEHIADQREFYAKHLLPGCEYLFPNNTFDGPMDKDSFREKPFKRLIESSGIKRKVTPHMLRHTYNTLLHESDVNGDIRQELVGHADEKSNRLYTHIKLDRKIEAVAKFSDQVDGILTQANADIKKASGDNVVAFRRKK